MSTLPAAGYLENTGRTNAEMKAAFESLRDILAESVGGEASAELTIASGSVTPAEGSGGGIFRIDTEGNAASDTLDTIAQTNTRDGQVIVLRAENAARVVTVNSGAGGTGQILLYDGVDFVFASTSAYLFLRRSGTDWVELFRFVPTEDLTALTTPDIADLLEIWDDSAGNVKKISTALVGRVVQVVEATPYTTHTTITSQIPYDDSIPQSGEGTEIQTVSITPTKSTHRLRIEVEAIAAPASATSWCAALFQDATAGALAAKGNNIGVANQISTVVFSHEMAAGTTSATTFKVRAGADTGNLHPNGTSAARRLGGVSAWRLRVTEIVA